MSPRLARHRELIVEVSLHRRPLAIEDAVDAGIADRAIAIKPVLPEHAVESGAQSLDRATAMLVHETRAKFNRDARQPFERVRQQEELTFGVQRRALHALSVPRRADLHASIGRVD